MMVVERCLLRPIREDMLCKEMMTELRLRVAKAVKAAPRAQISNVRDVARLRTEIGNLTDAIASGALRTSKAMADRLATSEAQLEQLLAVKPVSRFTSTWTKCLSLEGRLAPLRPPQ
jgi:hypothetical protein